MKFRQGSALPTTVHMHTQTDEQTVRQTNRQSDRQTDTHTHACTHTRSVSGKHYCRMSRPNYLPIASASATAP